MADRGSLRAVLPLLLLSAVCRTTGATPSWETNIVTADTTDKYIKDSKPSESVISIYEDVPIGHMIAVLHIDAKEGDSVTVTQDSTKDVQLYFNATTIKEQNVYIMSTLDRESDDKEVSISVGVVLNGGSTNYFTIQVEGVNDNKPMFSGEGSQIQLDVPENKLNNSLLILTATDQDFPASTLTYSLDTDGNNDTFSLDTSTANCQLQLLKELDYEKKPLYRLTITVTDEPDDRGVTLNSSVTVFVNVKDVGDTAPRWLVPPMASDLDEKAKQGDALFTVEAIDGDLEIDNDIIYSILDQTPEGIAVIKDETTGEVTLTKELDREDPDLSNGFITLVIQAGEKVKGGNVLPCTNITCAKGTALITVNDLDDNLPVLNQTEYSVDWTEETPGSLGLSIIATDKDPTPANSLITMTLLDAPEGVFEITPNPTGAGQLTIDIRIKNSSYLDYEDESLHNVVTFKVVATGQDPADTASATVTINLQDKNDETPEFDQKSYKVDINETESKGFSVITVSATDKDASDEFGTKSIRYSIRDSGKWRDAVTVNEITGEVTLAEDSAFDCENGADAPIDFTITASDMQGGGGSNVVTAILTITVLDVDDTPPELNIPSPNAEVMEEEPDLGINITISALDADVTSLLEFSIDWDNTVATKDGKTVDTATYNYKNMFQITSAGKAEDDIKAQLSVNGSGPDREMMDTIKLHIVVTDTNTAFGTDFAESDITVKILDKNDNKPEFTNVDETTRFNVTENMPKTSTINQAILATDVDEANQISYSLTDALDLVTIDANSGQLSVKGSIDREKHTAIEVTVTATDSGKPPSSSSITISIDVLDQNDNGPDWVEVPSDISNLTVQENDMTAAVYKLLAADIDEKDTLFSNITYSLSEDSKKNFTVDPVTGEVTTKDMLDREELADQNYIMTIQVFAGDACDENGNCAHSKEGLLRVRVLDANDCPPVFPQRDDILAQVIETTAKDNQLATVRATDADAEDTDASKLTYTLENMQVIKTGCEGTKDIFYVETDEANNQATIKAKRDLQGCWGDYNLTLSAKDTAAPQNDGTGVYQVRIVDKNDPPQVLWPADNFAVDLREDSYTNNSIPVPLPDGKPLAVNATDPDDPDTNNAKLSYTLSTDSSPDDARSLFYVNPDSGQLMVKNALDRESPAGYIYTLKVEVQDHGDDPLNDTVTIIVTITDVDEFDPEFVDRTNDATHFTEENPKGQDVKDITSLATDKDDTDIIFYFLVGGDTDVFELVESNATQPQLRNKKKLDREEKDSYQLILQTTRENKQPPHVDVFNNDDPSQLNLTVKVQDINDVTPSFGNRRFMGGIAVENTPNPILLLESDDPDLNDTTTYSITSEFKASDPSISNISNPFVLSEGNTAALNLNFDVNEGMDGYFDFQVTAEDKKKHKNATNVRIFIIIEDDRVKFVFANLYSFVQGKQNEIADVLTDAFSVDGEKYVANIESVLGCTDNPQCTNVITHFIDDHLVEPVLADVIINMQFQDDLTQNLIKSLRDLDLNLTAIGDTTVTPEDDNETLFQMLLIVVASVMGGILALTCITSCLHTHKLRRQVKALSINAFGSHESGLQNAGQLVPGSNMFANQGANPIFTNDDKTPMDAESVSSGDSVLIGVEDEPEFADSSRSAQKRPAPAGPLQSNPAYQPDSDDPDDHDNLDDHDDLDELAAPAVFDENSHHHMPTFDPDDDEDLGGASPFGGGGGGMSQNPLFGADGDGASQNPLFGAEMGGDGDLSGPGGMF